MYCFYFSFILPVYIDNFGSFFHSERERERDNTDRLSMEKHAADMTSYPKIDLFLKCGYEVRWVALPFCFCVCLCACAKEMWQWKRSSVDADWVSRVRTFYSSGVDLPILILRFMWDSFFLCCWGPSVSVNVATRLSCLVVYLLFLWCEMRMRSFYFWG